MSVIDMLVAHIAGTPSNVTGPAGREVSQETAAGKSGATTEGLFSALLGALTEETAPPKSEMEGDADSRLGLQIPPAAAPTMSSPEEPVADAIEAPSDVSDNPGKSDTSSASPDATPLVVPVALMLADAQSAPIAPLPATKLEVETPTSTREEAAFASAAPAPRELPAPVATFANGAALPAPANATLETVGPVTSAPVTSAPVAADEAGPFVPVAPSLDTSSDAADDRSFEERSGEEGSATESAATESDAPQDASQESLPREPLPGRATSRTPHEAKTSAPDSISVPAPDSAATSSAATSSPSLPIESVAWTLKETPALLESATNTSLGPSASAPPASSDSLEWTPEIRFELAARAKEFLDRGETEIRLTLDPPSLGKLRIRLEIGEGRVAAHLVASSAGTAALLDRHREELVRAFAAQGIQDVSVEVGAERDFDRRGSDFFEERGTFDRAAPLEPVLQHARRFSGARARVDLVA